MELPVNPVLSSVELAHRIRKMRENYKEDEDLDKMIEGLFSLLKDCIHTVVEYETKFKDIKNCLA